MNLRRQQQLSRKNGNGRIHANDELISVRGARVHNLRDLDVDIPRDRLVVITGVSGSGKSSLAFDTLFAEGQRRYLESLSAYARQFLDQLQRPDVDVVEGLPPTVSIDQRAGSLNPRSTVATVTEIYDYLRLLWARLGTAHCWQCGRAIRQQTPEQIVDTTLALGEGKRVMVLAPLVRGRKGHHEEVFAKIRKAGLVRARVDGKISDADPTPALERNRLHTIEAVVDRIVLRSGIRARLVESIHLALKLGDGSVVISHEVPAAAAGKAKKRAGRTKRAKSVSKRSRDGAKPAAQWSDHLFSARWACPQCGIGFDELAPRTFSFNSPYGACAECEGLGYHWAFDPELVIPDVTRALGSAVAPWRDARQRTRRGPRKLLKQFAEANDVDLQTAFEKLPARLRKKLLYGDRTFPGVLPLLDEELEFVGSEERYDELLEYVGPVNCSACGGTRLGPQGRSVRLAEKAIDEVTAMTVHEANGFFGELSFEGERALVADPVLREIRGRLRFLRDVGLGYLTLDRRADSLSGGESQRIRLAAQLGAGLIGVCYILDEPTIGLHQRDNDQLVDRLEELRDQGNSVLVVEHDENTMRRADHVLDLGPGAGVEGGALVAEGPPEAVAADEDSLTGLYLAGRRSIPVPARRRKVDLKRALVLAGVRTNNLRDVTVHFPLGTLAVVTGVSGSGKSSLVTETLARALERKLHDRGAKPGPHRRLTGTEHVEKLMEIDQSPIGRTPRSNPATYTGVFDEVRRVFARTRESRLRGYKPGRFSFNVKGGRCEECQGHGTRKIAMHFLPDIYVPCEVCRGARFNRQTLEVRYRGKSIADVLNLRVDEARSFFAAFPRLFRLLNTLHEVGLGYVALGQPSTTLSGGEAQRIKLATDLGKLASGKTVYILDEPTTGLHFADIEKLLHVLGELVDRGNTVVVIEHNLDVIKSADYVIDLGPEAGDDGGSVVVAGTPEEVAACPESHTGQYLRGVLGASRNGR